MAEPTAERARAVTIARAMEPEMRCSGGHDAPYTPACVAAAIEQGETP